MSKGKIPTPAPQKSSTPATNVTTANNDIILIDELQNHGINASDIQKLKSCGICSISVCFFFINFIPFLRYINVMI